MAPSWRIKLAKGFGLAVPAAIVLMVVTQVVAVFLGNGKLVMEAILFAIAFCGFCHIMLLVANAPLPQAAADSLRSPYLLMLYPVFCWISLLAILPERSMPSWMKELPGMKDYQGWCILGLIAAAFVLLRLESRRHKSHPPR